MRSRTVYRYLSRQLIRFAMRVAPWEREEWARAMRREVDAIPSDREALRWALGCLQASCHWRLKSMRPANFWLVRWGMALWVALVAADAVGYAGLTLTYKLGFSTAHAPYPWGFPWNVPLLEVTPLWDPILSLLAGVALLLAVVLILRRKRVALEAVVAPLLVLLLLFAVRVNRPESGWLQSVSTAYQRSHSFLIWPILGLAATILICVALWQDRRIRAPRQE
jgi:hypothetical protein